jgi:hypothetical protein
MNRLPRAIMLVTVALALNAAAEPRQPTARWTVDFDDAQCVASRNYGTPQKPLQLVIKALPLGDVVQVGIIRPDERAETTTLGATVTIDDGTPIATRMLAFTPTGSKQRAYLANLPVATFTQLTAAKSLSFVAAPNLDEQLTIAGLAPLMKIMNECVADLRAVWPGSENGQRSPKTKSPPSLDLGPVLNAHHYPGVASARLLGGAVKLVLLIDESGKVADCTVIGTSGAASLGVQACALVSERGTFKPATGLDGKPSKSSLVQSIDWRVGGDPVVPW